MYVIKHVHSMDYSDEEQNKIEKLLEKNKQLEIALSNITNLFTLNSQLANSEDMHTLLEMFLNEAAKIFIADVGVVIELKDPLIYQDETDDIIGKISLFGINKRDVKINKPYIDVLDRKITRIINVSKNDSEIVELSCLSNEYKIISILGVKIKYEETNIGYMLLHRIYDEVFSSEDERIFSIMVNQVIQLIERIKDKEMILAKNKELEKFNNLMLGREIKMVELKKEITDLKQENLILKKNK